MTVAENIRVAVGLEHLRRRDPDATKAMRSLLDDVHFQGHLEDRVSSLSVARRHLLELAKAFAVSPRLLILDEPTAPLSQDSVELLFTAVRKLAGDGTAVVYITHRLGEVREIADRVTVLRDGAVRGTSAVTDISDADLLAMIIGRTLEATFPPKHTAGADEAPLLRVEGLSGHGFDNISFTAARGEIVGVAGVVGNGQPALLRALAGREPATGSVNVAGKELSRRALLESAAYMPADRLTEGLMLDLNVRENAALTALDRLTVGPLREQAPRGRRRRTRALRAGGQGAVARGARLGALRREPAEDRDGARDALRARDSRRGRADAGGRRRRACGDLPHPARSRRPRSAGRRRLQRHHRARGAVRPRDRDVPRPGGRDARGRRRDRGADRPRCDQRDHAHRGAGGADAERLVAARAVHRRRLRAGRRPRRGDARPRSLRPVAEQPLPLGLQHHLRDVRVRGARLHLSGTDIRAASRRDRSLRRPTRRLPRRRRVVLRARRSLTRGLGARVRPDVRVRGWRRPSERRAHPLREVHARRRDARHVHRAGWPGLHAARLRPTDTSPRR